MGAFSQAQAGNADALSALLRRHIPLVQALARRFSYSEDAFQQGCMGLLYAIRHFQEDSGCQFSTYAVPAILGEMRKSYAGSLGWRTRSRLNRAKRYQERVLSATGKEPCIHELAAYAGIRPAELMLVWEWDHPESWEETAIQRGFPDPNGEMWLTRFFIRDILERMGKEESWLIRQRFVLQRTQTEIARRMRATQSAVSRKEKSARKHFLSAWQENQS